MFKKFIISLFLLTLSSITLAEICPSISEIKNNYFHGWDAYNSNNGLPLTPQGLEKFKKHVNRFLMAEWAEGAPEGSSHCYYGDKKNDYMDGYLARHGLQPDLISGNWQNKSIFVRCQRGIESCVFIPVAIK